MSTSSPPCGNDFTTRPRCSEPSAMRTTAEMSPRSSPVKPTASLMLGFVSPSWPGSMIQTFPASTSSAVISFSFIGSPTLRNLSCRRTLGGDRALPTLRPSCHADTTAVPDHPMREVDPLLARQELHQVLLDF